MRQSPLLLLFLGLSATVQADSLSDENARLKQQVSALQSRVETLERACPAASSAVVVQPGIAAVAPAVPAAPPAPAVAAPRVAPAAPAVAPPPDTSITAETNLEGTPQTSESGQHASIFDAAPKQKYSDAGCDRGLFSGPDAGRWQKLSNWKAVTKGMTPAEVETAIGVEHYDVTLHNGRTQWQYGRCSSTYDGSVEFLDGRVVYVGPPDR